VVFAAPLTTGPDGNLWMAGATVIQKLQI